MKVVYYAHSKRIYDTPREKGELNMIKAHWNGDQIIDPSKDLVWEGDMEPYFNVVRGVDYLVCSEYKGHVGKGVFDEVNLALANAIPVFVIRNGNLQSVADTIEDDMSDWAVNYGKLITSE